MDFLEMGRMLRRSLQAWLFGTTVKTAWVLFWRWRMGDSNNMESEQIPSYSAIITVRYQSIGPSSTLRRPFTRHELWFHEPLWKGVRTPWSQFEIFRFYPERRDATVVNKRHCPWPWPFAVINALFTQHSLKWDVITSEKTGKINFVSKIIFV